MRLLRERVRVLTACIWRRRLRVAWSSMLRRVSRESSIWKRRGITGLASSLRFLAILLPLMLLAIGATFMAPYQCGCLPFGDGNAARGAISLPSVLSSIASPEMLACKSSSPVPKLNTTWYLMGLAASPAMVSGSTRPSRAQNVLGSFSATRIKYSTPLTASNANVWRARLASRVERGSMHTPPPRQRTHGGTVFITAHGRSIN